MYLPLNNQLMILTYFPFFISFFCLVHDGMVLNLEHLLEHWGLSPVGYHLLVLIGPFHVVLFCC